MPLGGARCALGLYVDIYPQPRATPLVMRGILGPALLCAVNLCRAQGLFCAAVLVGAQAGII